jgi:GT2 family glycosyltransferase
VTERPSISLCILCHDRPAELSDALASAAADGPWAEVVVLDMASDPPIEPVAGVTWLRSDENVGVTKGRNLLAGTAKGDVLVFLDDDAVFVTPVIAKLTDAFGAEPTLGAVAVRVRRQSGEGPSLEHPFRGSAAAAEAPRECAYFVGCGYAIRREAHLDAGGYDDRFFYSTEEVDLSFRLLRDGWRLRYDPALEVEHRPSPKGRGRTGSAVPGWRLRNRFLLVRAHLPVAIAVPHAGVWVVRTGVEAVRARSVKQWWRLGREGLSLPVDRRPLGWRRLARIHRLGGRVLY